MAINFGASIVRFQHVAPIKNRHVNTMEGPFVGLEGAPSSDIEQLKAMINEDGRHLEKLSPLELGPDTSEDRYLLLTRGETRAYLAHKTQGQQSRESRNAAENLLDFFEFELAGRGKHREGIPLVQPTEIFYTTNPAKGSGEPKFIVTTNLDLIG